MSSLERVPDYREFGLERLHCIRNMAPMGGVPPYIHMYTQNTGV